MTAYYRPGWCQVGVRFTAFYGVYASRVHHGRRHHEVEDFCRLTADFNVVDPYRMTHTDGSTEKPDQPVVHA